MSEQKSQSNTFKIVLAILLGVSIAGNIIQMFRTQQVVLRSEKREKYIDTLTARKVKLEKTYAKALNELEQYKGKSKRLDSLLTIAEEKLLKQKKRIAYLIDKKENYEILQQRFQALNKTKNEYLKKIQGLIAENKRLRYENTALQVEIKQTSNKNQLLQGKVNVASRLELKTLNLKAYNQKRRGRERETESAGRADKIAIYFTVDKNTLAPNGDRSVYIRIKNPEGFVVTDISKSVRKFKDEYGNLVTYSREMPLSYAGKAVTKRIDYNQEGFRRGTYAIEVYIDNYKVGAASIRLK